MSSNDELVTQFISVTGCSDASTASNYIEMSGGNVETAVGLYLEHQGGGGAGAGAAMPSMVDEDNIRAPDATRTMRLMDEGPGGAAGMLYGSQMDPAMRMMQEMMEEQLARSAFAESSSAPRPARDAVDAGANDDMDDGDDNGEEYNYDDEEDDYEMETDDAEAQATAAPRLSDMFAAPEHLKHKAGGFQGARQMAKDSKRWLLVNIQKDSEFSSHALNRDVWRNDLVENLIQEGFIFWQEFDISMDGQQYVQRYKVNLFPHVGIIGPRTGRLLWSKEGWTQQNALTAEVFAKMAMDFCSRNSFDKPPEAPIPPKAPSSSGAPKAAPMALAPSVLGGNTQQMTEEEQIQAAINASLSSLSQPPPSAPTAAASTSAPAGSDEKPAAMETSKEEDAGNLFLATLLAMDVGPEPSGGARMQLRMPDGKRNARSFDPKATVEVIYAFVAQSLKEGGNGAKKFKLMAGFPPKDLLPSLKSTIEESSLKGEAITIRWA